MAHAAAEVLPKGKRLLAGQPPRGEVGDGSPAPCQPAPVSEVAPPPSPGISQSPSQAVGGCPELTFAPSPPHRISHFWFLALLAALEHL